MTKRELVAARSAVVPPAPLRARRRAASYYDAASTAKRLSGWQVPYGSINSAIVAGGDLLRQRARHAVRNNVWAGNAINTFSANVVGTGIKPKFNHPDPEIRKKLARLWKIWTREADADGACDFYGLQALACRSTMESGECLARLRPRRLSDGMTVPLQLQLIESEHLPFNTNEDYGNGFKVRAGIKLNAIRQRVSYFLYRDHPGEFGLGSLDTSLVEVPASSILHMYQVLRPGQLRGQPWLTSVLLKLWDLERYDDAELVRKKLSAMLVAVIYDEDDQSILPADEYDEDDTPISVLEPGTTTRLRGNQRIEFSDPKDVGGMYKEFMKTQLRAVAAGLGVTYEQIANDLEGVTFSSIRAGLQEYRRKTGQFQHQNVAFQFCDPVMKLWLEQAALAGRISAKDFYASPELYLDVDWMPAAWDWVDPAADVDAKIRAVNAGFTTRSAVIHELGEDPEAIDAERAEDDKRAKDLGIRFPELEPKQVEKPAEKPAQKQQ
jgi:lambda family phage portal protein